MKVYICFKTLLNRLRIQKYAFKGQKMRTPYLIARGDLRKTIYVIKVLRVECASFQRNWNVSLQQLFVSQSCWPPLISVISGCKSFQTKLEKIMENPRKVSPGHCVKNVHQIRSFFWSEYSKIRTRKNSIFEHFSHSWLF